MGNPKERPRVGSSRRGLVAAIACLAVSLLDRTVYAGADAGADAAPDAAPAPDAEPDTGTEMDTGVDTGPPMMVGIGAGCSSSDMCPAGATCVDDVCCTTACSGQCQACNTAGMMGTCVTIKGPPVVPRPACPQSDPSNVCSSKTCDGTSATSCTSFVGSATMCGIASCVDGFGTPGAVCEGDGGCQTVANASCGLYACISEQCATSCTDTSECSMGNFCHVSTGKCVKPGAVAEEGGASLSTSSSSTASGCSIGSAPRRLSPFAMAAALLGTWAVFRRRRR
jgi:hypothetical protein